MRPNLAYISLISFFAFAGCIAVRPTVNDSARSLPAGMQLGSVTIAYSRYSVDDPVAGPSTKGFPDVRFAIRRGLGQTGLEVEGYGSPLLHGGGGLKYQFLGANKGNALALAAALKGDLSILSAEADGSVMASKRFKRFDFTIGSSVGYFDLFGEDTTKPPYIPDFITGAEGNGINGLNLPSGVTWDAFVNIDFLTSWNSIIRVGADMKQYVQPTRDYRQVDGSIATYDFGPKFSLYLTYLFNPRDKHSYAFWERK